MLSKSRLIAYRQCERRLWLEVYRPEEKKEDEQALHIRLFWGNLLNKIARTQYPEYAGGVLIGHAKNPKKALAETNEVFPRGNFSILYEPAFAHQNVLVRVDILKRNGNSFDLIEIKSSTSVKNYHYEDCAVQAWVLQQAGIPLSRIVLAHLNSEFIYEGNGDYQGLLVKKDITKEVKQLIPQVSSWINRALQILSDSEPIVFPGPYCRKPYPCPFTKYCDQSFALNFPVWRLPYVNTKDFLNFLLRNNILEVSAIPEKYTFHMDKRARAIWEGVRLGREVIHQSLREALRNLSYPRFYFDFETVSFAIPVWKGTRPYHHIPFQWSCHIERAPGVVEHHEFIDLSWLDPRPGVINSLIKLFENTEGPIIVYGDYEERIFRELARDFPVFRDFFEGLTRRVVNLYSLVSQGYRHPKLQCFSLKNVATVAIPNFSYKGLDISEGSMATYVYLKLFYQRASTEEIARYRQALLSYCKHDTKAIYLLVRELS